MSSQRNNLGEDSLRGSDRERRTLEERLRAALTEGVDLVELPDDSVGAPLELTERLPETQPERAVDVTHQIEPETPIAAPEPATAPEVETSEDLADSFDDNDMSGGHEENHPAAYYWNQLPRIPVEPARLERNLVITANRHDPAHAAFDVLRTKIVQAMQENGWSRIGITSATAGAGKSFTAINLAVTLSRLREFSTILMDLDLRRPGLARTLGLRDMPATADFLRGEIPAEDYLSAFAPNMLNIGDRLAVGVNGRVDDYASELLHNPESARVIEKMKKDFGADLLLFDLPPALAMDDVLAFRPHLDCVLIVVGGGETRTRDMREVQRRLGDDLPILGVVLNKADIDEGSTYSYGY